MTVEFKLETFSGHVGEQFVLSLDEERELTLELIEAEPLRSSPGAPREDPFCLMLRGPADVSLPQGNYELKHESLGTLTLFLLPRQPDESGSYYEVIFN